MAGPTIRDDQDQLTDELKLLRNEIVVLRETLDEFKVDSVNVLRSLAQQFIESQPNKNQAPDKTRKKLRVSPYWKGFVAGEKHQQELEKSKRPPAGPTR